MHTKAANPSQLYESIRMTRPQTKTGLKNYVKVFLGLNIPDKQIDLSTVADFENKIKDYVYYITFQGCSVAEGADGAAFLGILASSIGKAGAWNESVDVVGDSYFEVSRTAEFVIVPEPATIMLFGLGGLALLRKRRA